MVKKAFEWIKKENITNVMSSLGNRKLSLFQKQQKLRECIYEKEVTIEKILTREEKLWKSLGRQMKYLNFLPS